MKKKDNDELFNIWTGYADLAVAIIFVLILFLVVQQISFYLTKAYKLQKIAEHQIETVNELKQALGQDSSIISRVEPNDVNQTISFKQSFLFNDGKFVFKESKSEELIRTIGDVLKKKVDENIISRIVVEGHTNSIPVSEDPDYGNWNLSALRAVNVVKILDEIGIRQTTLLDTLKPSRLLSISGYAQYDFVPIQNSIEEDLEESKRIQFFLVYTLN